MAQLLQIEIVTPRGRIYAGEAEGVIAPGVEGYFGLLPRHAPLVAELGIGELRLRHRDKWERFALSGGILQIRRGRVIIIAEAAERPEEIDVARAEAALRRAQARLAQRRSPEIDALRAEAALKRALNRLRVAGAI